MFEKFIDYGLVYCFESLNVFVVCSYKECGIYKIVVFVICNDCGKVIEFVLEEVME